MLKFEASIHGSDGKQVQALNVTFDAALPALQRLERLFIEPDGSFVWTGMSPEGVSWQVDGNLIDRGDWLAYVELKGFCPDEQFDMLLAALGWPEAKFIFQLRQHGTYLDEAAFRRMAATETGAL